MDSAANRQYDCSSLARPLADDLRRPWERPAPDGATDPGPDPQGI